MYNNSIYIFLKNIWPNVYRHINNWFSFLLRLLKQTIGIAVKQIKP